MSLTDLAVRGAKPKAASYKVADSAGLYLLITPGGGKLWRFDYQFAGKRKTLALGKYPMKSLADARRARDDAKDHLERTSIRHFSASSRSLPSIVPLATRSESSPRSGCRRSDARAAPMRQ